MQREGCGGSTDPAHATCGGACDYVSLNETDVFMC